MRHIYIYIWAIKGVYGNLLPYFPRKCSWSWVPNLGLLENSTAKCHSFYCAYVHAISALWTDSPWGQSYALSQTPIKVLSESLTREPSTSEGTDINCVLLGRVPH